jgi:hypothetical protein
MLKAELALALVRKQKKRSVSAVLGFAMGT